MDAIGHEHVRIDEELASASALKRCACIPSSRQVSELTRIRVSLRVSEDMSGDASSTGRLGETGVPGSADP